MVHLALTTLGGFALIGFLISLIFLRQHPDVIVGTGVLSFGCAVILYIYDFVLSLVMPADTVLLLGR